MILKGYDISHYQGIINFNKLKNNCDFVLIKATEGITITDSQFINNQNGARSTGLLRAYYHFARPSSGNSPETEADFFLKTVGELQDGEILCLDYEDDWSGGIVDWCRGFLDHVSSKCDGIKPLIYLNQNLAKTLDWSSVVNENYGLWLADYDNSMTAIPPSFQWPKVTIKQYYNQGIYNGVTIDEDIFYGNSTDFTNLGYNQGMTLTTDQQNVLNYLATVPLGNFGNYEGMVRAAIGDMTEVVNLQNQVTDLTSQIATLTTQNEALNSQVTALQSQVTALNSQVTALQTQLSNILPSEANNLSVGQLISLIWQHLTGKKNP